MIGNERIGKGWYEAKAKPSSTVMSCRKEATYEDVVGSLVAARSTAAWASGN